MFGIFTETTMNFYKTVLRHIASDNILCIEHRENLNSHTDDFYFALTEMSTRKIPGG
jgi:hypothetical protein